MKKGAKVCPLCLCTELQLTTDDVHKDYILECKFCHIKMQHPSLTQLQENWNERPSHIWKDWYEEVKKTTHDIEGYYWDENKQEFLYVTKDDVKQ